MHRTPALLTTLALATVLLAGCSEKEGKTDDPPLPPPPEGKGLVHGVVVDPSITPVAGATVRIDAASAETTTDDDGSFLINDLDPGPVFLTVSKVGYATVQVSATVEADEEAPARVTVQITPDPSNTPFTQQYVFEGFIQCSVTAAVPGVVSLGGNACSIAEEAGVEVDDPLVVHELARVPDWAQTEMVWDSTQPAGDALQLMHSWECDTNNGFLCDQAVEGVSPLTVASDPSAIAEAGYGPDKGLMTRVFSSTVPESQGTAGVTFDQKFEQFTTVFYGFQPDPDWRFVEDGAHPVPS